MIDAITFLFGSTSVSTIEHTLACMRIAIGLLMVLHGYPKMGGIAVWRTLYQTFIYPLGINFLPLCWGFAISFIEFICGCLLILGLGTRIASISLVIAMIIAVAWHLKRGDSYQLYSHPLALIVVFLGFTIIGGGSFSLDHYFLLNR